MKRIAVLGSTGSIGRNTLEVIRNLNRNDYPVSVEYLTATRMLSCCLSRLLNLSLKQYVFLIKRLSRVLNQVRSVYVQSCSAVVMEFLKSLKGMIMTFL